MNNQPTLTPPLVCNSFGRQVSNEINNDSSFEPGMPEDIDDYVGQHVVIVDGMVVASDPDDPKKAFEDAKKSGKIVKDSKPPVLHYVMTVDDEAEHQILRLHAPYHVANQNQEEVSGVLE